MKKITFTIPDNFQVPEGTEEGETFEASATLKLEGENLCLVALDGAAMPGYEDERAKGEKAAPDLAGAYAAAMQPPEGGMM